MVEPERTVRAVVHNQGPAISSPGRLFWLIGGHTFYETPLDAMRPGSTFQAVVPWRQLPPHKNLRFDISVTLRDEDLDPTDDSMQMVLRY